MKTAWVKGLEADSKAEMKLHFNGGVQLRKRLSVMLNEKVDAKNRESIKDDAYENPCWAFKMADYQGYKRAISEVLSLIE
jgi:hypothetical protein